MTSFQGPFSITFGYKGTIGFFIFMHTRIFSNIIKIIHMVFAWISVDRNPNQRFPDISIQNLRRFPKRDQMITLATPPRNLPWNDLLKLLA